MKPKYFSCDELLTSQICPWWWEKNQEANRKEKQGVAWGEAGPWQSVACLPRCLKLRRRNQPALGLLVSLLGHTSVAEWGTTAFQPWISGATLCGWSLRDRREFHIALSPPGFLARGLPGQTLGFSLRIWNERNSPQKWSHSCFNRY